MGILYRTPDKLIRAWFSIGDWCRYWRELLVSSMVAFITVTNPLRLSEEGDIRLTRTSIEVYVNGTRFERPIKELDATVSNAKSKGEYKHFMLKEIYEQPEAIQTISQALKWQ